MAEEQAEEKIKEGAEEKAERTTNEKAKQSAKNDPIEKARKTGEKKAAKVVPKRSNTASKRGKPELRKMGTDPKDPYTYPQPRSYWLKFFDIPSRMEDLKLPREFIVKFCRARGIKVSDQGRTRETLFEEIMAFDEEWLRDKGGEDAVAASGGQEEVADMSAVEEAYLAAETVHRILTDDTLAPALPLSARPEVRRMLDEWKRLPNTPTPTRVQAAAGTVDDSACADADVAHPADDIDAPPTEWSSPNIETMTVDRPNLGDGI